MKLWTMYSDSILTSTSIGIKPASRALGPRQSQYSSRNFEPDTTKTAADDVTALLFVLSQEQQTTMLPFRLLATMPLAAAHSSDLKRYPSQASVLNTRSIDLCRPNPLNELRLSPHTTSYKRPEAQQGLFSLPKPLRGLTDSRH